jgi:hypothetical protein
VLRLGRLSKWNAQGASWKSTVLYASPLLRRLRSYQSEVSLPTSYDFLDRIFETERISNRPSPETLARLRAIIDEAFGRSGKSTKR